MNILEAQTLTPVERPRIVMPSSPPTGHRRKPGEVVRSVDTGETASDIVRAWEEWLVNGPGLKMTDSLRGIALRTIKGLLAAQYTAKEAKWALAVWVAEWASKTTSTIPHLNPNRLEEIALAARTVSDPQAVAWRDAMRTQVQSMSGGRGSNRTAIANVFYRPEEQK